MSTDDSQPSPAAPGVPPAAGDPGAPSTVGAPSAVGPESAPEQRGPGWFERNATLVIAVSVAVIAVVAALVALFFYRESEDDDNAATEDAVSDFVEEQGGELQSVECDGDTCSAIVGGQAYTVLVHEDDDGEQTFGITAYTGD